MDEEDNDDLSDLTNDGLQPSDFEETTVVSGDESSSPASSSSSAHLEVVIGILTAVIMLLLFLFFSVVAYSRREKFLSSPTSRSLNPFPGHINMKVRGAGSF